VETRLYDLDPGPDCFFRLDRALYSPFHYPGDAGSIPGTLVEDHPGVLIAVRPVGVLEILVDQMFPHIDKKLEGKRTEMPGWRRPRDVREVIRVARSRYLEGRLEETTGAATQ